MANLYYVTTFIHDFGKIVCRPFEDGDIEGVFDEYDCYIDEFDTLEEANAFIEEGAIEEPGSYTFFDEEDAVSIKDEKKQAHKISKMTAQYVAKDILKRFNQIRN